MPKILEMTAATVIASVGELGNKKKEDRDSEPSDRKQTDE